MSGALWAVLSGVGFGLFQTLNRRAVQGMDVFVATFLQLAVSAIVLVGISAATVDRATVASLTAPAVLFFAVAGVLHFFIGWTFLNASQKHIGAARTSSLIGSIPIFAAFFAAVTLAEVPTLVGIVGIALIVAGVYLVNYGGLKEEPAVRLNGLGAAAMPLVVEGKASGLRSLRYGLAAAVCWSLSPTFIRYGLAEVPNPLLGVTVGIVASALGYAVLVGLRQRSGRVGPVRLDALGYKVAAAVLVALATWLRWISLDLIDVAVALALSLTSVPVVNILSPLVSGRDLEQVNLTVWLGSALIIAGSLVLIFLD